MTADEVTVHARAQRRKEAVRNAEEAENTGYVVSAASDGHFLGQGIDILPGCGQVLLYNNIGCGRTDYSIFSSMDTPFVRDGRLSVNYTTFDEIVTT